MAPHGSLIASRGQQASTSNQQPHFCAQTIRPLMDEVRQYADALEGEVANELWSYPTYQEMLFIK